MPPIKSLVESFLPARKARTHSTQDLRLVIGTGRSGTTWLGDVLGATSTPLRYLGEPLYQLVPKLDFSPEHDHTSLTYGCIRGADHPLPAAYAGFLRKKVSWKEAFSVDHNLKVRRDDPEFAYCLVKEVHSLLDIENLARTLRCPIILISRDPLKIVDSILFNQGTDVVLWENEFVFLQKADVLDAYFPGRQTAILGAAEWVGTRDERERTILKKIFSATLLREILRAIPLRLDNVRYVDYESLCADPVPAFREAAAFFGFEFESSILPALEKTMSTKEETYNPYSIYRNTSQQLDSKFKFLTENDLFNIQKFLERIC